MPFLILLIFFTSFSISHSQITPNHNFAHLNWQTFETEHFKIVFHDSAETVAWEVADIAESVYDSICTDLGTFPPRKTSIIVSSFEDFSNGLANPVGHYIYLDTANPKRLTAGNEKWLEGLVAHEFTHIVTFHAMNFDPLNLWEYAALLTIPAWFTEGIAQFEGEKWETQRELLLRNSFDKNCLLTRQKMGGFPETGRINSRLVYEQGHSLIRFIVSKFGKKALKEILRQHKLNPINFSWTLKRSIGIWEDDLFDLWKAEIQPKIQAEKENFPKKLKGRRLKENGLILGVRETKKTLAFVKIENQSVWQSKLFANGKEIDLDVEPYFDLSKDGNEILYSKFYFAKDGSYTHDIFHYNLKTETKTQITFGQRASDPIFYGKSILFSKSSSGKSEIFELEKERATPYLLTDFPTKFSPQSLGRQFIYSFVEKDGSRGIAKFYEKITEPKEEARDGFWKNDSTIIYVSYETGIPNLKEKNILTGKTKFLTNSFYGIFNPSKSANEDSVWVITYDRPKGSSAYKIPIEETQISSYESFDPYKNKISFEKKISETQKGKTKGYNSFKEFRPRVLAFTSNPEGFQTSVLAFDPLIKNFIWTNVGLGNAFGNFNVAYSSRHFLPTLTLDFFQKRRSVLFKNESKILQEETYDKIGATFVVSKLFNSQQNLRRSWFLWSSLEVSDSKNNEPTLPILEGKNGIGTVGLSFANFDPTFYATFRVKSSLPKLANRVDFTEANLRTLNYFRIGETNFFLRWQNLLNYRFGEQTFDEDLTNGLYYFKPLVGAKESLSGKGTTSTTFDLNYSLTGILNDFTDWTGIGTFQPLHPYFYFNRFNLAGFFSAGKSFGDFTYKPRIDQEPVNNSPNYIQKTVGGGFGFTYWIFGKAPVVTRLLYGKEISKGKGSEFLIEVNFLLNPYL
ncbi:MAG: hypothetical protein DWQ06_15290 [Calditrichaeota bacterium]|nr:MAG: hypothetical protein DWQ06_15290 [Calditrichota bacterium]